MRFKVSKLLLKSLFWMRAVLLLAGYIPILTAMLTIVDRVSSSHRLPSHYKLDLPSLLAWLVAVRYHGRCCSQRLRDMYLSPFHHREQKKRPSLPRSALCFLAMAHHSQDMQKILSKYLVRVCYYFVGFCCLVQRGSRRPLVSHAHTHAF